jgi:hypothetical protein
MGALATTGGTGVVLAGNLDQLANAVGISCG